MSMIDDIIIQARKVETALKAVADQGPVIKELKEQLEALVAGPAMPAQLQVDAATAALEAATNKMPLLIANAFTESSTLSDLAEVIVKQIKIKIEVADIDVFTRDGKVVVTHGTKTELDNAAITQALLDAKNLDGLKAAASYTQDALKKITGGDQLIKDHSEVVLGSVKISSAKLSKDDQVEILPKLSDEVTFIARPSKAAVIPVKAVSIKSSGEEGAKELPVEEAAAAPVDTTPGPIPA